MKYLYLLLAVLLFVACSKDNEEVFFEPRLLGKWEWKSKVSENSRGTTEFREDYTTYRETYRNDSLVYSGTDKFERTDKRGFDVGLRFTDGAGAYNLYYNFRGNDTLSVTHIEGNYRTNLIYTRVK